MPKKKQTFEQALARLEEIIDGMENNSPALEEMFALYKEGVELTEFCVNTLDAVEKEVTVLRQGAGGNFTQTPLDGR